jgi:hypothetical protein
MADALATASTTASAIKGHVDALADMYATSEQGRQWLLRERDALKEEIAVKEAALVSAKEQHQVAVEQGAASSLALALLQGQHQERLRERDALKEEIAAKDVALSVAKELHGLTVDQASLLRKEAASLEREKSVSVSELGALRASSVLLDDKVTKGEVKIAKLEQDLQAEVHLRKTAEQRVALFLKKLDDQAAENAVVNDHNRKAFNRMEVQLNELTSSNEILRTRLAETEDRVREEHGLYVEAQRKYLDAQQKTAVKEQVILDLTAASEEDEEPEQKTPQRRKLPFTPPKTAASDRKFRTSRVKKSVVAAEVDVLRAKNNKE